MSKYRMGVVAAVLVATAVLAAQEGNAPAQQEQEDGQLYFIRIEHVKPAMQKEYEQAAEGILEEFKKHEVDPEALCFQAVSGAEFGYLYAMPLENFASMDELMKSYGEAIRKIGQERWRELTEKASEMIDYTESFHVKLRPDLSYMSEGTTIPEEDGPYINYRFYYVIPGKEQALEDVTKQFLALYKKKGVESGWRVYESVTGTDLPLYVVAEPAQSPAAYAKRVEELRGELGVEARNLTEKALSCLRRIEEMSGWMRPDLSYPSSEMEREESN